MDSQMTAFSDLYEEILIPPAPHLKPARTARAPSIKPEYTRKWLRPRGQKNRNLTPILIPDRRGGVNITSSLLPGDAQRVRLTFARSMSCVALPSRTAFIMYIPK